MAAGNFTQMVNPLAHLQEEDYDYEVDESLYVSSDAPAPAADGAAEATEGGGASAAAAPGEAAATS